MAFGELNESLNRDIVNPGTAGTPYVACNIELRLTEAYRLIDHARELAYDDHGSPELIGSLLSGSLCLLLTVPPALDHVREELHKLAPPIPMACAA